MSIPIPRIAQAIQQDLAAIGIKAEIKSLAQAEVIAAGGAGTAPMVWSGGMAWITDFPDPADFFGGSSAVPAQSEGGWNWAKYCNKSIDERTAKADAMVKPEQAQARIAEWRAIFGDIMKEAPWAPVFNEKHYHLSFGADRSDRNVFIDPIDTPLNFATSTPRTHNRSYSQIRYVPDWPCCPRSKWRWFLWAAFEPGPRTVVK